MIDEVLQRDPKNAMALADLAFNWHWAALFGWTTEPEAMERMADAGRRAVAADDQDAMAHTSLAVYELFSNRHDDAIRACIVRLSSIRIRASRAAIWESHTASEENPTAHSRRWRKRYG